MIRARVLGLALAALACPAAAECVDLAAAPPLRAAFEDGTTVEVLSREGGLLRYRVTDPGGARTEQTTHLGTVPLEVRRGEAVTRHEWDTPLPALSDLVPGARLELAGRMVPEGGDPGPASLAIEIGSWAEAEIDGCTVRGLRTRLRFGPADRPVAVSDRLWDPATLLSYETVVTTFAPDGTALPPREFRVRTLHRGRRTTWRSLRRARTCCPRRGR